MKVVYDVNCHRQSLFKGHNLYGLDTNLNYIKMNSEEKTQHEITVNLGEANFKAMAFAIPILFLFGLPFFMIWGKYFSNVAFFTTIYSIYSVPVLIGGIIAHELIHGIVWSFYAKKGFKSISFGINWRWLTPYCHCAEPLNFYEYRIGIIMPAILLGFIPFLLAILTGSMGMFIFGLFFTLAAGGDFLMMFMLRKVNKYDIVQDHPSKIGCIVFGSD